MDSLIVILLIIIGFAAKSSKKKKQAQQRARQAGFDEAAALERDGAKPSPAERVQDALEGMGEEAAKQLNIPYSKEDWAKLVREKGGPAANAKQRAAKAVLRAGDPSLISQMEAKQAPKAQAASAEGQKFQVLTAQRLDAQRLRLDARHLEGESRREHEAHKQRIAEEEARLHREREELRELRNVNLKKLRSAVVMSEVLGKPVALRGRR